MTACDDDIAMGSCAFDDVDRVVVTAQQIRGRLDELAGQIARSYRGRQPVILGVLTGSVVFMADLIRRLPMMMRLSLVSVQSYRGVSPGADGPVFQGEPSGTLAGADVLVLDDILDTGSTLRALLERVRALGPASVRTCVLLRKVRPGIDGRPAADFVGFEIPDEFVVGYGLDYNNLYRNLPDVCVLKPRAVREKT